MRKLNQQLRISTKTVINLIVLSLMLSTVSSQNFKRDQLKYERVRKAYSDKEKALLRRYQKCGFKTLSQHVFLRAFKESGELELWVKNKTNRNYVLVYTYSICAKSGTLGPKRKMGDMQVPEGFYRLTVFNPVSNFYLSLGVSYPNTSDRILGEKNHLGGDIFIHGDCVTIGCMPLTDEFIKEIYIACVEAKNGGQEIIPVHIFPYRMNTKNHLNYSKKHPDYLKFWNNIKEGYDYFEYKKTLPVVSIDKQGKYHFN